jgi:predicted metal-dependent hydrolase
VQFRLPFDLAPDPVVSSPGVEFVRVRSARRYILRVRPDGALRITVPRGGSRAEALRFAERHRPWIERERARVRAEQAPATWRDGTTIVVHGTEHVIRVAAGGESATYAGRVVTIGSPSDLRAAIESDLKQLARAELVPRLHALAAQHEVSVTRVLIRNQRSRWGSCSPSGVVALNFRLVQMPPEIRDYVLVHELMHRRHQNHSRRFWRLVEAACPDFREAERWLRTRGRSLF